MKRLSRWQWTLMISVTEIAVLLIAHRILIVRMAEGDTISHIFAAGPHVPASVMVTVIAFLVVRLLAVLALPGMILARIGLVAMDWWRSRAGRAA